ncbi:MAG TPA: hypothetical protein VLJ21_01685 [Candidatus Binatia bacterium]|nr:hypothetical protein [Candidatus Binatia bacterium]
MAKITVPDTLESIIREVINRDPNWSPPRLSGEHLDLLAKHWPLTKQELTRMILNDKNQMRAHDIMVMLDEQKKLPIDGDYLQQTIYPKLIRQGRIRDLTSLTNKTIMPTSEQISAAWTAFFKHPWTVHDLDSVVHYFGKPPVTQAQVDQIGKDWLTTYISKREEGTELRRPEDMRKIVKLLGAEPRWDKKLAERVYNNLLEGNWWTEMWRFCKDIGAKPAPRNVQRYYASLLSKKLEFAHRIGDDAEDVSEKLEEGMKILELKPEKKHVERFYRTYLSAVSMPSIKRVEKLTGVPLPKEIIHEKYRTWLLEGDIGCIVDTEGETGVLHCFDDATIQQAYANHVKRGSVYGMRCIAGFTHVNPQLENGALRTLCKKALKNPKQFPREEAPEYHWLAELFPQVRNEFQKGIRTLIKEQGSIVLAETWASKLRIEPLPPEACILAYADGQLTKAKEIFRAHHDEIQKEYPRYAALFKKKIL